MKILLTFSTFSGEKSALAASVSLTKIIIENKITNYKLIKSF